MSDLVPDRWTLTVEFDPLSTHQNDGFYGGFLGEAADFYAYLLKYWAEAEEYTRLEGDTVIATVDVIDCLAEPVQWVIMHTIPKRIELVREGSRP